MNLKLCMRFIEKNANKNINAIDILMSEAIQNVI